MAAAQASAKMSICSWGTVHQSEYSGWLPPVFSNSSMPWKTFIVYSFPVPSPGLRPVDELRNPTGDEGGALDHEQGRGAHDVAGVGRFGPTWGCDAAATASVKPLNRAPPARQCRQSSRVPAPAVAITATPHQCSPEVLHPDPGRQLCQGTRICSCLLIRGGRPFLQRFLADRGGCCAGTPVTAGQQTSLPISTSAEVPPRSGSRFSG